MSRASHRIVVGFVLLLSVVARAQEVDRRAADEARRAAGKGGAEVDADAQAKLDRKLPEINFTNNKFTDVIDFLRDVTGANLFVNWRALETAGLKNSVPVTVRLKDVKFERALRTILDDVGGGKVKLDYIVDEGVITISTVEDLRKNTATHTYDVRFLLVVSGQAGKAAQTPEARQERVDAVIKLVTGTVDPDSWHENGGHVGTVKELSGQLIVTQTEANQKAIENLITQTRKLLGVETK
jgi:hypothetical protein